MRNGHKLTLAALIAVLFSFANSASPATFATTHLRWDITSAGRNQMFKHIATNQDYLDAASYSPNFSYIRINGQNYGNYIFSYSNNVITAYYASTNVIIKYGVKITGSYMTFTINSITGNTAGLEYVVFGNCYTTLTPGDTNAPFMACSIACNLQTKVVQIPGPSGYIEARAYPKFGLIGAKVGVIGTPPSSFREAAKALLSNETAFASDKGGPWALDCMDAKASYFLDNVGITTSTVDDWIDLCDLFGISQIDIHGAFENGLFTPKTNLYPNGISDLQSIISTLHSNGKKAGYHNYAMFISKNSPYVAPIPDSRLAYKESFTLAQPMTSTGTTIYVNEDIPADMNTTTGFLIANSVTMWIDNELIAYTGIDRANKSFTGCTRGSCGTTAASHSVAAQVKHIKEMFNCFVPSPDSTLLVDVASDIAQVINTCGFDMVYFDAIDGAYSVYDSQDYWYYQAKFIYEVMSRCTNKPVCEMSTMSHHFWAWRSRLGALDTPYRAAKSVIDVHCMYNNAADAMFLPANMGWWKIWDFNPVLFERTTYDIMEYLCWKSLAYDRSISLMQFEQPSVSLTKPYIQRLGELVAHLEDWRATNYFSQAVKDEVKVLGNEFCWVNNGGVHTLEPVQNVPHQVINNSQEWSKTWTSYNKFGAQPVKLRIEAQHVPESFDSATGILLLDPGQNVDFIETASGVTATWTPGCVGALTVKNNDVTDPKKAWAKIGKIYSTPLNLINKGLVLKIKGDNNGEVVNLQWKSTEAAAGGILDRYVPINFNGSRWINTLTPESDTIFAWGWPYIAPRYEWDSTPVSTILGKTTDTCITQANLTQVAEFNIYVTNIPMGKEAVVKFSEIKAVPIKSGTFLTNPTITVNGKSMLFRVTLTPGQYVEFKSLTDCKVYDNTGAFYAAITPILKHGVVPALNSGNNTITCDVGSGECPPIVTVTSHE